MARLITMVQRRSGLGRMFVRGNFTQKKNAWEVLEGLEPSLESMVIFDDVTGLEFPLSYRKLCDMLRKNGRAVIARPEGGNKEFLLIESEANKVREWDVDEDGIPIPNPVGGTG